MAIRCAHVDQARRVEGGTPEGCEECLQSGDRWEHLRLCLSLPLKRSTVDAAALENAREVRGGAAGDRP